MRDIKFRAWWGSEMFYDLELTFNANSDKVDILLKRNSEELLREWQKNLELMEYTGLKDKNGVEIFEGDIVLALNEGNKQRRRYYIHYQPKQAEWQLGNKYDWGITSMHYVDKNSIEVMGNIYENKELL